VCDMVGATYGDMDDLGHIAVYVPTTVYTVLVVYSHFDPTAPSTPASAEHEESGLDGARAEAGCCSVAWLHRMHDHRHHLLDCYLLLVLWGLNSIHVIELVIAHYHGIVTTNHERFHATMPQFMMNMGFLGVALECCPRACGRGKRVTADVLLPVGLSLASFFFLLHHQGDPFKLGIHQVWSLLMFMWSALHVGSKLRPALVPFRCMFAMWTGINTVFSSLNVCNAAAKYMDYVNFAVILGSASMFLTLVLMAIQSCMPRWPGEPEEPGRRDGPYRDPSSTRAEKEDDNLILPTTLGNGKVGGREVAYMSAA